jgi:hypothetical protein
MVQGESYEVCGIGALAADGTAALFPHETAYAVDKAFEKFAAYLKRLATEGETPVDALDLLLHQKATGTRLVVVSESMLLVNGNLYQVPNTRAVKKNFSSDFIYGKLEAVLPKVAASTAGIQDSAQAVATPALDGPSMIHMGIPGREVKEEPRRGDPAARKPMRIIVTTQGSAAQDSLAEKMKEMEKDLGVRAGHDGGGLKSAMIMTTRKTGAVLLGLNALTDDEITERDSMALAGGATQVKAAPKTEHVPVRRTAAQQAPEIEEELAVGEDLSFEPATLDLFDPAPDPVVAPRPVRPPAMPVTVMTGEQAEHLAASTSGLSSDARLAQQYRQHEAQAEDLVGEDIDTLFSSAKSTSRLEDATLSAELADTTQDVSRAGRQIQKTGVTGTGRGGARPGSTKPRPAGR